MVSIISFLNTIVGRLISLLIIFLLTKNNTTYGLVAVFAFILLREYSNKLIEGQENMDDGPSQKEIDEFNKEIKKTLKSDERDKVCEKLEGDPDPEVFDIYKKSMFDGSNSISSDEFLVRLMSKNPYYKHYEKKHGSTKLISDTVGGLMSGCYDGYGLKISLLEPKSLDNSMDSVGSAGSSVGDMF